MASEFNSIPDVANHIDKRLKGERRKFLVVLTVSMVVSFVFGIFASSSMPWTNQVTIEDPNLSKLVDIYTMMKDRWYFGNEIEDLEESLIFQAIEGMMAPEIDPHTRYVEATTTAETKGIGISVSPYDGYFIINEVYLNTPAYNAGIRAFDLIVAINSTSVFGVSLEDLSALITAHDDVDLTYRRNLIDNTVTMIRSTYTPNTVTMSELSQDVVVMKVTAFNMNTSTNTTATEAKSYLDQITVDYSTLVIDLRNNGGGSLEVLIDLADLFLPKGDVVLKVKTKDDDTETPDYSEIYYTEDDQAYTYDQIIIMLNGGSASASEVFALALNDNLDNCFLMGTQSYGKGTAQQILPLEDGSSFRYTYAKWYSPMDISIHGVGITPEVEIEEEGIHLINIDNGNNIDELLIALGYTTGTVEEKLVEFQTDQGFEAADITGTYNTRTQQRITKIMYDAKLVAVRQQIEDAVAALPN